MLCSANSLFKNESIKQSLRFSLFVAITIVSSAFGADDALVPSTTTTVATARSTELSSRIRQERQMNAKYALELSKESVDALNDAMKHHCANDIFRIMNEVQDPALVEPWMTQRSIELQPFAVYWQLKKISTTLADPREVNVRDSRVAVDVLNILGNMVDSSVKREMKQHVPLSALTVFDNKAAQYHRDVCITQTKLTIAESIRSTTFATAIEDTLTIFKHREDATYAEDTEGLGDDITSGTNGLDGYRDFFLDIPDSYWFGGMKWAPTLAGYFGYSNALNWEAPQESTFCYFSEYDTTKSATPDAHRRKAARDTVRAQKMVGFLNGVCGMIADFDAVCAREGKIPGEVLKATTRDDLQVLLRYAKALELKGASALSDRLALTAED